MDAKVANMETKSVGIRDRKTLPERRALLCILSTICELECINLIPIWAKDQNFEMLE